MFTTSTNARMINLKLCFFMIHVGNSYIYIPCLHCNLPGSTEVRIVQMTVNV